MKLSRRLLLLASAAALTVPLASQAQPKPIRLVVGFPPGGATDAITRAVADKLPGVLGQPVIVDNKPGVGGRIAADLVLGAPADGLTFMVAPNATPTFQMLVFKDQIKWNSLKDFVPVASFASYPLGMGVPASLGVNNAREFIEWVKKNPGKASFGTPGLGGQNAFLGVQLAKTAGIDLPVTPYKGSPPMVTDLVGGHVPSAISLLDGMSKIDALMDETKALGMDSIAITDHGALYGTVQFVQAATKRGIKPIIGVETYVARRGMGDKEGKADQQPFHLVLLATSATGYRNLCRLVTDAHLDGMYYKPRIDLEHLAKHSEGLIGLSGCLNGEIARALEVDDWEHARALTGRYGDIFGKDRFYLEVQDHGLPEQKRLNEQLFKLGENKTNVADATQHSSLKLQYANGPLLVGMLAELGAEVATGLHEIELRLELIDLKADLLHLQLPDPDQLGIVHQLRHLGGLRERRRSRVAC